MESFTGLFPESSGLNMAALAETAKTHRRTWDCIFIQ